MNKEFGALIVDDLSRLSRNNYQMMTLINKFNFYQIKIISVSDGINTDDENSKLGIQLRGLVNELFLDDLRKKTSRGLEGQKLRGFSAGERVYGYYSAPIGELNPNKRGRTKCDGMVHKINAAEAEIVKRIYLEFSDGKSINKIINSLNMEKVPTRHMLPDGWNSSTVSRILKNEKYAGVWNWRKTKNVKDAMTGKCKSIPRAKHEHIPFLREDLRIVGKTLWDKVQKRWIDIGGTWPIRKRATGALQQRSYVYAYPKHLLSGLMKCVVCSGAFILTSGKGGGYYGCQNARRGTCQNRRMIKRLGVEQSIISRLKEDFLTVDRLGEAFKKLEESEASQAVTLPTLLKDKDSKLVEFRRMLENCLDFIKAGNASKSVAEEIKKLERGIEEVQVEIETLKSRMSSQFKAPTRDWIKNRLERLNQALEGPNAALAIKELVTPIILKPRSNSKQGLGNNKPHSYVARTTIRTTALLNADRAVWRGKNDDRVAGDIPVSFSVS